MPTEARDEEAAMRVLLECVVGEVFGGRTVRHMEHGNNVEEYHRQKGLNR